jgi:hypothetical protein
MSFLIDRRGVVRFIAAGAGEEEIAVLGKMIKKLVEEPADDKSEAAANGSVKLRAAARPPSQHELIIGP